MFLIGLVLGVGLGAVCAGTKAGRAFTVVAAHGLVLGCAISVVLVGLAWLCGFVEVSHAPW